MICLGTNNLGNDIVFNINFFIFKLISKIIIDNNHLHSFCSLFNKFGKTLLMYYIYFYKKAIKVLLPNKLILDISYHNSYVKFRMLLHCF